MYNSRRFSLCFWKDNIDEILEKIEIALNESNTKGLKGVKQIWGIIYTQIISSRTREANKTHVYPEKPFEMISVAIL